MTTFEMTVTPAAMDRFKELAAECAGIRLGVKSYGCAGVSYALHQISDEELENPKHFRLSFEDVDVFIDKRAVLFLIGTTIDYEDTPVRSGFRFSKPGAQTCGCSKSFEVDGVSPGSCNASS